jgi:hypothetical protein
MHREMNKMKTTRTRDTWITSHLAMNHDTIAQLQMQTNIMHVALDHAHRLMHIRRRTVRLALVLSIHLVVQLTVGLLSVSAVARQVMFHISVVTATFIIKVLRLWQLRSHFICMPHSTSITIAAVTALIIQSSISINRERFIVG